MAFIGFDLENTPVYGRFILANLAEGFQPSFSIWSVSDYQQHWKQALRQALTGKDTCLIVNWNPIIGKEGFSGEMWDIYWIGNEKCVLQNSLILNENYPNGFINPNEIKPLSREVIDEDGDKISEWDTSRVELLTLLNSLESV